MAKKSMTPSERREAILKVLCQRRQDKIDNLQVFISPDAASGRRTHWFLEEARTSGSMSRVCSDGRKAGSISGIPTGNRPPSGNMTVRRQARTIRP